MLNAVNINFVAFDAQLHEVLHGGQTFALFTIVIAAAEIGLALAIVLLVFRTHGNIDVDALRELADRDESAPVELEQPMAPDRSGGVG
jgi:NADH-quinone oxidoreductase subunit K